MDALNRTGLGSVLAPGGADLCGRERRGQIQRAAQGKVTRMVRVMQMMMRGFPRVERRMIRKCNIVGEEKKDNNKRNE